MTTLPQEYLQLISEPWFQYLFFGEVQELTFDDRPMVQATAKQMLDKMAPGETARTRKNLDESTQRVAERFEEDFPDYGYEWSHVHSLWAFVKVFRWILNLVFIALPWSFIAQVFVMYNLWFNIKWNFLWAGGNVFLLLNSIYAIQQSLHSTFLVTELPIWMRYNKGGRWFMLALALLYNLFFTGFLVDFYLLLYVYDKSEYGFGYLLESMFFGYNLVLHFPIAIVNLVVIFKEFSLEFL